MLHLVVNCGPAEEYIARCIDSIRSQSLEEWQAHVTIDPCGDDTEGRALAARGGDRRIGIHCNGTRRHSMFIGQRVSSSRRQLKSGSRVT